MQNDRTLKHMWASFDQDDVENYEEFLVRSLLNAFYWSSSFQKWIISACLRRCRFEDFFNL